LHHVIAAVNRLPEKHHIINARITSLYLAHLINRMASRIACASSYSDNLGTLDPNISSLAIGIGGEEVVPHPPFNLCATSDRPAVVFLPIAHSGERWRVVPVIEMFESFVPPVQGPAPLLCLRGASLALVTLHLFLATSNFNHHENSLRNESSYFQAAGHI
jgi:hypothetical protein